MKFKSFMAAWCAVLVLAAPFAVHGAPLANDSDIASGIELLETWIETQMKYRDIPAVTIGVLYDQEVVWIRGFGEMNRETHAPAAPNTVFRIASISKLFTSIAILQLRDEGKLRLDDPIKQYLPWFSIKNRFPDSPPVTVRHLLTHTSGLPREAAFPYWTDFDFPTREEIREALPNQETALPTETKWKYSNLGLALAGEVVIAASGQPYEEYIRTHILDPLGMKDTYVAITPDFPRLATGYGRRMPDGARTVRPFTDSKGLTPAANLSSTVEDFAKFAAWQFRLYDNGGTEVLKASTLKEMHRVQWLNESWKSGWGLGFSVTHTDERDIVGHGGHVGGYTTQISLSPKEKIAVFVMTNTDDGDPGSFVSMAFKILAPPITKATAKPEKEAVPDPAWKKYVGAYIDDWDESTVMIYKGRLTVVFPQATDPTASMVTLKPDTKPGVFRIEGSGGQETGETCTFETGPDGNVIRMKFGENYSVRVK